MLFNPFQSKYSLYRAIIFRYLVVLGLFTLTRLVFYWENKSTFFDVTNDRLWTILLGGIRFDLSAMGYLNALWLLLLLIPIPLKYRMVFQKVTNVIFIFFNSIGLLSNLVDSIYFPFAGRRTSLTVFSEFGNENNFGVIFFHSLIDYWYLTLLFLAIVWILIYTAQLTTVSIAPTVRKFKLKDYGLQSLIFVFGVVFIWLSIRGSLILNTRAITISNAGEYTNKPNQISLVVNTPFNFLRTMHKQHFKSVSFYKENSELSSIYTPVHQIYTNDSIFIGRKNVVIFILESFAAEYSKIINPAIDFSYTPFLDSLYGHSLLYTRGFTNGRKSIDAMPAVLGSITNVKGSFVTSKYVSNDLYGLSYYLGKNHYSSLFAHGAPTGSMGFNSMATILGFKKYIGMDEYDQDEDFDGSWGIWDHKFFPYFADEISKLKPPFVTSIFSVNSHHPFKLPEGEEFQHYKKGKHLNSLVIQYTDESLRKFFAKIKDLPWYQNTLFVFTADHTSTAIYPNFSHSLGRYRVPIAFFTPDGSIQPKIDTTNNAQHTDIFPTVLSYLGITDTIVSFGHNLNETPTEEHFVFTTVEQSYQLIHRDYAMYYTLESRTVTGIYNFRKDKLLEKKFGFGVG